jgi:hypothetical protein
LQDTVLSAAQANGLIIDFAIGPNQGAGVPAPSDSAGLLWDLESVGTLVSFGSTYNAPLPGWGSNTLVAATTSLILSSGQQIVIAESSLTDITQSVDENGNVNINFPASDVGLQYIIIAYYLKPSEYREVVASDTVAAAVPQTPITSWEQNGSWVVDHFSELGAQTVIDYWEQELLDDATKELLQQVGNYLWEDSQEFGQGVNTFWTPQLPTAFLEARGYSINKYLPLIINTFSTTEPRFILDSPDGGAGYVADYRQTVCPLLRTCETERHANFTSSLN